MATNDTIRDMVAQLGRLQAENKSANALALRLASQLRERRVRYIEDTAALLLAAATLRGGVLPESDRVRNATNLAARLADDLDEYFERKLPTNE